MAPEEPLMPTSSEDLHDPTDREWARIERERDEARAEVERLRRRINMALAYFEDEMPGQARLALADALHPSEEKGER